MIGQVIGSYRIVAELGQGGMRVVYRAEHVQLGRPVAIKMLLPQIRLHANYSTRATNVVHRAAVRVE